MNLADARAVLLLRAVETRTPAEAGTPPAWSAADAAWADDEAHRALGAGADVEAVAAARARLAHGRLAQRDDGWPALLADEPGAPWRVAAWAVPMAALLLGLAGDALAGSRHIDLLAPPLLLLMLWNLAVYALLLASAARGQGAPAWARRLGAWLGERAHRMAQRAAPADAWRLRWQADCTRVEAPAMAHRAAGLMHAGAALLALGLLAGLYARGLVLDYRAGWDSTFLDAAQVRAIVGAVLGPAAALLGRTLPDAAQLAGLRWSAGTPGAPAATWIHLYALTVAGVVVLPRVLLAVWSARKARLAVERLNLPLGTPDDAYWQAMRAAAPAAQALRLTVLAYSHQPTASQALALPQALTGVLGSSVQLAAPPRSLPMGTEDDVRPLLRGDLGDAVVLLYTLAATPERETHGAFAQAVAAALPAGTALHLAVDTGSYRQRLANLPEAATRLQQRRDAWLALCTALNLPTPRFIDLEAA